MIMIFRNASEGSGTTALKIGDFLIFFLNY